MADALSKLREFVKSNRVESIEEEGDEIHFGDLSFSKTCDTNYMRWGSETKEKDKEYYKLGDILYFLKNENEKHADYVKSAAVANYGIITRPDRNKLLRYLKGDIDTTPQIDKSKTLSTFKVKRSAPLVAQNKDETKPKKIKLEEGVTKPNSRLDELLDGEKDENKQNIADSGNSSLTAAMGEGRIKALRAKMMAHKKKNHISNLEDYNIENALEDGGDNEGEINDLLHKERVFRTRETVLRSNVKDFSNIFQILQSLKTKSEGGKAKQPQNQLKLNGLAAPMKRQPTSYNNAGYSRYDQERFGQSKEENHLGFSLQTQATYHGNSLKAVMEGAKKTQPSNPSKKKQQDKQKGQPQKRVSRTPIIVIPASLQSLITLYNVQDLLQNLKFVTTRQKKAEGGKREAEVFIHRKRGDLTIPYKVVENINKLQTLDDWNRVVGVFVLGPTWQFKGWPWFNNGSPVEIFSKIQAFHIKYSDQMLDKNVSKWNVHVMQINPHKRHMDQAVFYKFWQLLDQFMHKNKSHLRF